MQPILFSIGEYAVSSFGFFLTLSVLVSVFISWRLVLVYDLDKEKSLDLSLIILAVGFISSRLYFVALNWQQFGLTYKIVFINLYPGLSFWGGFFGGVLALLFFSKRFKFEFWQASDFATAALFIGISIASLGCLLGGCQYGQESSFFLAVNQIGLVGRRFPIQIIESAAFLVGFIFLWQIALRFHFTGKVATLGLIIMGTIKFTLEFFRGDVHVFANKIFLGEVFSLGLGFAGGIFYYKLSKRSFSGDLRFLYALLQNRTKRDLILSRAKKNWYNVLVGCRLSLENLKRNCFKFINVKSNPRKF